MIFFVFTFILLLNFLKVDDKLIFVMTHFRHGARSPAIGGAVYEVGEVWENTMELTEV